MCVFVSLWCVVVVVWFGLVWFLVWFGLVWFGLVWFGFGLVWSGSISFYVVLVCFVASTPELGLNPGLA